MRIIGLTILHYGADYLAYALRSVAPFVDRHYILYTASGSHGHRTERACPDTRHQLYREALRFTSNIEWVDGAWRTEGEQRDYIHQLEPNADLVLVADADEVWGDGLAERAIDAALWNTNPPTRHFRMPMIHYWRSFRRAVLRDPAYPIRMIAPKVSGNSEITLAILRDDVTRENAASIPDSCLLIHHFGYAQRSEIVEYKQHTHGHRGEWRRDIDWFTDRFMANAQRDCHPVGSEYWNPEPVPAGTLPKVMQFHRYAALEVIP